MLQRVGKLVAFIAGLALFFLVISNWARLMEPLNMRAGGGIWGLIVLILSFAVLIAAILAVIGLIIWTVSKTSK